METVPTFQPDPADLAALAALETGYAWIPSEVQARAAAAQAAAIAASSVPVSFP
jgi:hypothetical protein